MGNRFSWFWRREKLKSRFLVFSWSLGKKHNSAAAHWNHNNTPMTKITFYNQSKSEEALDFDHQFIMYWRYLTRAARRCSVHTTSSRTVGWWDHVAPAAKDPINGVTEAFLADPSPYKINLGVVMCLLLSHSVGIILTQNHRFLLL